MPATKSSAEIRQAFLSYFETKGHTAVASSSLVPGNDPTLLFTNAGMVQFKDIFLGNEHCDFQRAVSSQRCVRAGGKHNDLENVGFTARHHTFFEMLGNFSFGDYFKREAIAFAWQFLTEILALPEDRLWITVHVSDDEAADIWLNEIGVSSERFSRLDEANFWQMGDTGPCGPCSEIFYDHGEAVAGGPPGSEEEELDRYIEIWNLVFMQYERSSDGQLTPLPKPSIDTGMGLERIAAVMQGVHSNYETDIFANLIAAVAEVTKTPDLTNRSLRVVADHIRSCSFLIVDGVVPSNEGRGYVLRRIIRRALRHGHKLGIDGPFFYQLVQPLVLEMGEAYPEIVAKKTAVEVTLRLEEEKFAETLTRGMDVLERALNNIAGSTIPGEVVFQLYDTYGFPVDLTQDIARERGYSIDIDGYEQHMDGQRERARVSGQFGAVYSAPLELAGQTIFTGYQTLVESARVVALYKDMTPVDRIVAGEDAMVVLDKTPFYGESGGQVGDHGVINSANGCFEVTDCQKQGDNQLHIGALSEGELAVDGMVTARVAGKERKATALNHSATHLLQAALRQVLGEHVTQKGSLVGPVRLRFDFSHPRAMTDAQITEVENRVNEQIRLNSVVKTEELSMAEALEKGAMALFGEKYSEPVRVLTMGDGFSVELCGGTHVDRTGDIGILKISAETGIAAGVRRIEAVTGVYALSMIQSTENTLRQIADTLKADVRGGVVEKTVQLVEQNRLLQRELNSLKAKLAGNTSGDLSANAKMVGDVAVVASVIEQADAATLRDMADQIKSRLARGTVVLGSIFDNKVVLVAAVTKNLVDQISASDLIGFIAAQVGGKGGGRADMAQGGGPGIERLPTAIESVSIWVKTQLNR